MRTEIINIGDELLNGTSVNTNATWLCERVVKHGGRVVAVTMAGDNLADIIESLRIASHRADLVIVTGGLGPTSDDKTKEATLLFFGGRLVPNQEAIDGIGKLFAERGLPLTERNIRQGWVPDNATIYLNPVGTAPGMEFNLSGVKYLFLPGVPVEMKSLVDAHSDLWLHGESVAVPFVMDEIMVIGYSESFVADRLSAWQEQLPEYLSLAYLPSAGLLKVRLSCFHAKPDRAKKIILEQLSAAMDLFPGDAFHTGGASWDGYFHQRMLKKGRTLATAESCTGGYLSHRITSVPGSSNLFKGGVVAYHNDIKTGLLGVPEKTLQQHGAVSEEVVLEMAEKVRKQFNTHFGVAISGIAGPDGGTPEKPVGTVWIAVADPSGTCAQQFLMGSHRTRNIEKSAVYAMKMVINRLDLQI